MDDRMESSAGLAFIQGAIVGAVAALLLAPRSGRELREQLREYGTEAGKRVRDAADRGADAAQRTVEKGRKLAGEAYDAGHAAMERERQRTFGGGSTS